MIKLEVEKTNAKIEAKGGSDEVITEMLIGLKVFYNTLKDEDKKTAEAFLFTLLEKFGDLFHGDMIRIREAEVFRKNIRRKEND